MHRPKCSRKPENKNGLTGAIWTEGKISIVGKAITVLAVIFHLNPGLTSGTGCGTGRIYPIDVQLYGPVASISSCLLLLETLISSMWSGFELDRVSEVQWCLVEYLCITFWSVYIRPQHPIITCPCKTILPNYPALPPPDRL